MYQKQGQQVFRGRKKDRGRGIKKLAVKILKIYVYFKGINLNLSAPKVSVLHFLCFPIAHIVSSLWKAQLIRTMDCKF